MKHLPRVRRSLHPQAHHLVRVLFLRILAEEMVETDVCRLAGIDSRTWARWKFKGLSPDLSGLEAVAAVVGLRLMLKPDYEREKKK